MAKHGLFPMFLFHFSVLNMDFSKLICQTWAFIIKKMLEMYCFHVFFKILAHVFSSLRFADAWNMFFTRTTRHFNNRKLLFLLQMTKHAPTFLCFQCFVPFFVLNMDVSNQLAKYSRLSAKKAKHVSFSCKCLQFLQEKHVLCCECQYIFYGHWPCCIQMDSIDSFKFLMRIILVSYLGLCFNDPLFSLIQDRWRWHSAQVSQDGDRQWQAQF
jgi:hypothetical protein